MNNESHIDSVIIGCMLGDGYIERRRKSFNGCFRYTSSSKQHTCFVHKQLKKYCTDYYQNVNKFDTYDNRTKKTYTSYKFKTRSLPLFTYYHKMFYKDKIKFVPKDIVLNSISLLYWYIGDGELNKRGGHIYLHTNSFTKDDVIFLCKKINELQNFHAKPLLKNKETNAYVIYIPKLYTKKFLSYIGESPFNDYKHKWNYINYKNKKAEQGYDSYINMYPELIEYLNNSTTIKLNTVSKLFNIPTGCINYVIKKNNIKVIKETALKPIIQQTLDEKIIKEWSSGTEIKKELGYNASAISECCRHKRKKYRNFLWKFK